MPRTKKIIFIFIFSIFLSLIISLVAVFADAQDYNKTVIALNQSKIDLQEMIEAGFNVLRVNDTMIQAEQLFEAQFALQNSGGIPDYSLILDRTEEITELREQAEQASDELNALDTRLKEANPDSKAFSIFNKAKEEFFDERYDKVYDLVEEAYTITGEEQALQTRFRAIYEAGTKTVFDFITKRWKGITSTIVIIIFVYLLSRKRVAIYLIDRKISKLNFEKEVLGKLIKKSQYEYFHLFKIPEELYHIRIEKFGELIRNIDRQIPLHVEEKERIKAGVTQESKASKIRKSNKELILASLWLFALVSAGIFSIIYFKKVTYNEISDYTQNINSNIVNSLNYIFNTYSIMALIMAGVVILIILSSILAYVYRLKKRKKEQPEIQIEKRIYFFEPLKKYLLNKFDIIKIKIKHSIDKIQHAKQYRKLLKQKKEEDMLRIRYLRKQRIILFKRNLMQKIRNLLNINSSNEEEIGIKDENKKLEGNKIIDFFHKIGLIKTEQEKRELEEKRQRENFLKEQDIIRKKKEQEFKKIKGQRKKVKLKVNQKKL